MSTTIHALRAAALLAAACAMPASAQRTADDPAAAVPETRYRTAHVQPTVPAPAQTPDQDWSENNRIVAGQDSHAGHAGPAKPPEAPADPHAGHHGHSHHGSDDKKGHH